MKFKTEDDAFDAYLNELQMENPAEDISDWEHDLTEGFLDWLDTNEVEIEEI